MCGENFNKNYKGQKFLKIVLMIGFNYILHQCVWMKSPYYTKFEKKIRCIAQQVLFYSWKLTQLYVNGTKDDICATNFFS